MSRKPLSLTLDRGTIKGLTLTIQNETMELVQTCKRMGIVGVSKNDIFFNLTPRVWTKVVPRTTTSQPLVTSTAPSKSSSVVQSVTSLSSTAIQNSKGSSSSTSSSSMRLKKLVQILPKSVVRSSTFWFRLYPNQFKQLIVTLQGTPRLFANHQISTFTSFKVSF